MFTKGEIRCFSTKNIISSQKLKYFAIKLKKIIRFFQKSLIFLIKTNKVFIKKQALNEFDLKILDFQAFMTVKITKNVIFNVKL